MERNDDRLYDLMKRFWTIDKQKDAQSKNNNYEELFKDAYVRSEDRRYAVKLPFHEDAEQKQMDKDFVHKLRAMVTQRFWTRRRLIPDGA